MLTPWIRALIMFKLHEGRKESKKEYFCHSSLTMFWRRQPKTRRHRQKRPFRSFLPRPWQSLRSEIMVNVKSIGWDQTLKVVGFQYLWWKVQHHSTLLDEHLTWEKILSKAEFFHSKDLILSNGDPLGEPLENQR